MLFCYLKNYEARGSTVLVLTGFLITIALSAVSPARAKKGNAKCI